MTDLDTLIKQAKYHQRELERIANGVKRFIENLEKLAENTENTQEHNDD